MTAVLYETPVLMPELDYPNVSANSSSYAPFEVMPA
jgi:hypothetical protein